MGSNQIFNKQYWLNHVNQNNALVAYSGLGAKCKVEIISRSDLLRARGFKIDDLTIVADEDTSSIDIQNNPPTVNFSFTIIEPNGDDEQQEINIDVVDEDNETQPVNEPLIQTEQEPVERQIQEQEQQEESAPTITISGGY